MIGDQLFHQREPVPLAESEHNGRELRHRTTVHLSPGKGKPCSVVCPGVQGRCPFWRCRGLHLSGHSELREARWLPPHEHHMEARPTHSGTIPQKDQQTDRGVKIVRIIRVVAAVICDSIQTKHKIYATARGYGDYKGQWEFPGGKIEPGETPQQALKREIEEELDTELAVHDKIGTIEYDYPTFHLSMDCFWCVVLSGDLILKEAEAARWLTKDELDSVQWLPADQTILKKIREMMK